MSISKIFGGFFGRSGAVSCSCQPCRLGYTDKCKTKAATGKTVEENVSLEVLALQEQERQMKEKEQKAIADEKAIVDEKARMKALATSIKQSAISLRNKEQKIAELKKCMEAPKAAVRKVMLGEGESIDNKVDDWINFDLAVFDGSIQTPTPVAPAAPTPVAPAPAPKQEAAPKPPAPKQEAAPKPPAPSAALIAELTGVVKDAKKAHLLLAMDVKNAAAMPEKARAVVATIMVKHGWKPSVWEQHVADTTAERERPVTPDTVKEVTLVASVGDDDGRVWTPKEQ